MTCKSYKTASFQRFTDHIALNLSDRHQLRLAMRNRRKAVPESAQRSAANAIARHLSRAQRLRSNQRIAVYGAFDGEIDVTPVIRLAKRAHCVIYAPRITNMRKRTMQFIELPQHHGVPRSRQRTGSILEPHMNLHRCIDPRLLDIVLIPLVAFDAQGWRLGFGAGFYDRKFAFMRRGFKKKPKLIGVGYEFQRVANQKPSHWDVLLDAVITERGVHRCS